MESLILLVGEDTPLVTPRRIRVSLRQPGTGRLAQEGPPGDEGWHRSVSHAWHAALDLSGRRDVDGLLRVHSGTPICGGSAGISVGLAALGALLDDEELAPHFASGAVMRGGFFWGGASARTKGEAAARLCAQLGWDRPAFVVPPLLEVPPVEGIRFLPAADLGSAYAFLHPDRYARIARRHERLRRRGGATRDPPAPGGRGKDLVPEGGLAALHGPRLPADRPVEELGTVDVFEGDLLLWRAPAGPDEETTTRWKRAARAASWPSRII